MTKLDNFMNMAIGHKGFKGDWVWANAPQEKGHPWCAAFVWTCAKLTGCGKTIIPYTYSARMMCKMTYEMSGKRWMSPAFGGPAAFRPRRGDLIFFRWSEMPDADWWVANHVGIVIETIGNTVRTIEGNRHGNGNNYASYVDFRESALTYNRILCYVRPNWPDADDSDPVPPYDGAYPILPIGDWESLNTRNDATIREVGYLSPSGFTERETATTVSMINYTSGLSMLMSAAGVCPYYPSSSDYIMDGLRPVAREIAQQLITQGGYSIGAAIGILGNIQRESDFQPGEVNSHGGASGLCQWFGERCTAMKQFVGPLWPINVSGQISYLIHEVESVSYFRNRLYAFLHTCPNSLEGAKLAADTFFHWYESLGTYTEAESARRIKFAEEHWARLVPQL